MLSKKLLFILLFSSLLLAQSNSKTDYFPLKDNITKKYEMPGANGNSISISELIIENNNQFTIAKSMAMGGVNVKTTTIYEIRENGIYEVASGGGMFSSKIEKHKSPYPFIKYPVKLKSKWNYTEDGGREIVREVISLLDECDVNDKTYKDVLKIKHTIDDGGYVISKYEYYANGIGLIKEETEDGKLLKYFVE